MPTDLDSRLRGNDGGAVSVFSGKYPQAKIPLFSQKQKTKEIRHSRAGGNPVRSVSLVLSFG
ncbi:hypothetical protein COI15_01755 [Neisseria meningitidis]|nr:hypothetical protein COI15_01755 [Neisseria meningitidis]